VGARTLELVVRWLVMQQQTGSSNHEFDPVDAYFIYGHDPYAYLNDVLTRLPTDPGSEIGQLLPRQWMLT